MKALLIAALLATSAPVFAAPVTEAVPYSEETPEAQEAISEGLIPADQLDASEYQTSAVETQQRWRPRPPRRAERWQCTARDRLRRSFRGDGRNVNEARREAMRDCERGSVVRGCRLVGCSRR